MKPGLFREQAGKMTKVMVVSSDQHHLEDIAKRLKGHAEFSRVAAITGGARTLDEITDPPDLLILNGAVAENGGLDGVERLGHRHPDIAVLVVSENPSADFLLRAMRAGVREVLSSPISDDQFKAALSRLKKRGTPGGPDGNILTFIPCKGGAGATFLAANLGYVLASVYGKKVALLDLNVQFGDAVLFVTQQRPPTDLGVLCREIERLDASLLAASMAHVLPNYDVLAAPEDPVSAADVTAERAATILNLARRQHDFVLVDLGRSLDAVTLQALDMADFIFPVVQLLVPFIRDAKRFLGVLGSLGYSPSKIKVLVNRYEKRCEITLCDLEKALGISVFQKFPNSYEAVAACVNQGVPIAKLARSDAVTRALYEFGRAVAPQSAPAEPGWLSRVLKRA